MNRFLTLVSLFASGWAVASDFAPLKADERIVFYPSIAERVPGRAVWRAEVRGCVFEPEKARLSVGALQEALELKTGEMTAAESAVFSQRARLFLVDHERGKKVFIRLGTNEFFVGKSGADGRFGGQIEFGDDGTQFSAILPPGDKRRFTGEIFPLADEGVSVISDIDDTIKITEVRDRQATLRNTFLREFQPVPGMAEFYQTLARAPLTRPAANLSDGERIPRTDSRVEPLNRTGGGSGTGVPPVRSETHGRDARATTRFMEREGVRGHPEIAATAPRIAFHYVSASPWQLYEPLSEFVRSNGFPAGTFHLKPFRWKDRSFFRLFADPVKYKLSVIEPLLKQFPRRKFMLIGDSGERDPEIYGELARKFPGQIGRIYIRDVTGEIPENERYVRAFHEVPRAKWQSFLQPGEIKVATE